VHFDFCGAGWQTWAHKKRQVRAIKQRYNAASKLQMGVKYEFPIVGIGQVWMS